MFIVVWNWIWRSNYLTTKFMCRRLLSIPIIHFWTLLVWRIFYTSADLLLFVPLSRHYSRIRKLPVNFVSEPDQCQSSFHALWFNTVNRDSNADYCTPQPVIHVIMARKTYRVIKLRSTQRKFLPVNYHHSLSWWLVTMVSGIVYVQSSTSYSQNILFGFPVFFGLPLFLPVLIFLPFGVFLCATNSLIVVAFLRLWMFSSMFSPW